MESRVERHPVAVEGFVAARVASNEPYVGMKDAFSIGRIERGHSEFWTHGRVWEGNPGAVLIQRPGDIHRDLRRDGAMIYQLLRFPAADILAGCRLHSCLAPDDARARVFHRLLDALEADRFTLECLIAEAIGALAGIEDARYEHTRPVRRALAHMREKIAEPLTLDELATHARLDKFHLCRAFREQVGMPPHAYLTQLRIVHAKDLLAAGAKPRDIASQVGLYDQSQLNRHFRRIVGMTPGEFSAKNCQSQARAAR